MTGQKQSRRCWGCLYLLALAMIGLLFLAHRMAPSPGWRTFLEIGVVGLGYGLVMVWLEVHPYMLLSSPPAETDSSAVELPAVAAPAPEPAPIRYQLYTGYKSTLINGGSDQPTPNLRSNGHHPVAEPFPPQRRELNPKRVF